MSQIQQANSGFRGVNPGGNLPEINPSSVNAAQSSLGNADANNIDVTNATIATAAITSATVTTLNSTTSNVVGTLDYGSTAAPGGAKTGIVVAYAPTSFGTLGTGTAISLNNAPGLAQATVGTDTNLALMPENAIIRSIVTTNNGTALTSGGAATINVGHAAFDTTAGQWTTGSTIANVNADTWNHFGSAAATAPTVADKVGAADRHITVTVNVAALTAGDLKVAVEYILVD